LPLVGASHTPGVVLAVGARRNGWLLAPLIAAAVARCAAGADPVWPDPLFSPSRSLS
jgi:glycine oxidase